MGFWVMSGSAILGIILIIFGFNKKVKSYSRIAEWFFIILGLVLIGFAIYLGI